MRFVITIRNLSQIKNDICCYIQKIMIYFMRKNQGHLDVAFGFFARISGVMVTDKVSVFAQGDLSVAMTSNATE